MSDGVFIDGVEVNPAVVSTRNPEDMLERSLLPHRIELWYRREYLLQEMWSPDTTTADEGLPMDEYGIPTDQFEVFVGENLKTEAEPAREAYLEIAQRWGMPRPKPRLFGLFAPAPPPPPPTEWIWMDVDEVRREGDYLVIAGTCISAV